MEHLTHDIFEANVYVFTPMGKVIDLPQGATPLDFAFRIHTRVGETATGAIVNGVMVPLSTELKTGDIIEIKTSKNAYPNTGWLKLVKTGNARDAIRKYLQRKQSEDSRYENIEKGRNSLLNGLIEYGISEDEILNKIDNPHILNMYNCTKIEDLYYQVSQKTVTISNVASNIGLRRRLNIKVSRFDEKAINSTNPVLVSGSGDIKATLSKCCRPIPGDKIVGYISKGKGITIHRPGCPNIDMKAQTRLITDVQWNSHLKEENYPVNIRIQAYDREQLLTDILAIFSSHKVAVSNVGANVNPTNFVSTIKITLAVKNLEHLLLVENALLSITGLFDIQRTFQ